MSAFTSFHRHMWTVLTARQNVGRTPVATLIRTKLPRILFILFVALIVAMIGGPNGLNAHGTTPPTTGHTDKIVLNGDLPGKLDLTPYLSWYVDQSQQMSLDDVRQLPFDDFQQSASIPSFGYTSDIIWYRIDFGVDQMLTAPPYIEANPSYLNHIDLYLFEDVATAKLSDAIWQESMGDRIPARKRPFTSGTHVASWPKLDAGAYHLFIRVQSNSTNLLTVTLWQAKDLISSMTLRNLATNIFFGVFLTLGITYFSLGLIARDAVVVSYGIGIACAGMLISLVNGVGLSQLRSEIPWMNDFLIGTTNIVSQAAVVFLWIHILEFRQRTPILFWLGCAYCIVILSFLIGTTNELYTVFGTYIVPSVALFMACACLVLVKRLAADIRNKTLWAYLIALALPCGPVIMLQLAHAGLIEVTPIRIGLHQFTFIFHIIAMGILMAIRLTQMDREQVFASTRAEETTSLVGEQRKLISMLSHEFRTPLAVIQRSSEMLMLRLRDHSDDIQNRLKRIELQARKLARLVDIFLSKDGIDDKEFSLARELVGLDHFMNDFVANTTRDDAEILVTCTGTNGVEAYIDETLIGLAMTNLVETSRRFAHGKPIHITARAQSNWLAEISIPCQGEGLDSDEIRLIGNALFRREMETKALRSALGLHISQRIVDAHGGSIKLRDLGPMGIALCVLLPCETSNQDSAAPLA